MDISPSSDPCPGITRRSTSIPRVELQVGREGMCVLVEEMQQHGGIQAIPCPYPQVGALWGFFLRKQSCSYLCSVRLGSMDYACSIFRQMDEPGSFQFNTMMRGHVKDMNTEEALITYKEMAERGVKPDNFTYPTLLKACARLPAVEEGMQVHAHILKLGLENDVFVQNSLISMYGKCGEIGVCCAVFEQMNERSVASWSALITAHASLGMWSDCLRLLGDMSNEGYWRAEESILVSVLSACTHLGALDLGRSVHGFLLRNVSGLNVIVETSLIEMYLKCGSLYKGTCLFQKMAKKNKLSYSVMISGLAMHGYGREGLRIFTEMLEQGLEPDDVVYVGVLNACSHAGLVQEGLQCFNRMKLEHGIEPTIQHYGCMVDLMGRAGKIDEALELIKSMPMEPNDVLWRSLLSASKVHNNLQAGEIAAKQLFKLDSQKASDYVVLSNMYAQAQRWEDVARTRTNMFSKGLSQRPGFSLVEVKRKMHRFVSQDAGHPQSESVYEMLYQMEWQLKFEGYSPDTTQVLCDVDEEEKKQRLSGHSQKLAIAYALIHTSQGSPRLLVNGYIFLIHGVMFPQVVKLLCPGAHAAICFTILKQAYYDRQRKLEEPQALAFLSILPPTP
ncbi:Pentatricopeptide repeat-containing protein [Vitis vinifera]|uniref:Pentatricopeptide repeat-containing protein n=1 Tax=Vitis vinifera TaxID=29760 RepID=A0A438H7U8_VITVI|nr:Pentatricopeptide repeat-containing protein [Vitis vinifera]